MTEQTTKANPVSLEAVAEAYVEVQRAGGTITDLMTKVGITNLATANQKLVKLRAIYAGAGKELPPLARRPRTSKPETDTVGFRALQKLSAAFDDTTDTDNGEQSDGQNQDGSDTNESV